MNLIRISDNILANPEMISLIELRKVKGKSTIVITIDGKQHIADLDPTDMMQELVSAGVPLSSKCMQFWAG